MTNYEQLGGTPFVHFKTDLYSTVFNSDPINHQAHRSLYFTKNTHISQTFLPIFLL